MTKSSRVPCQAAARNLALLSALVLLAIAFALTAHSQQSSATQTGNSPTLSGGTVYTDQSSDDCEKNATNNPYAGMDPLACVGKQAPVDSAGNCSLKGMTLWKKVNNTCYYCSPINPPIVGIVIPLDQLAQAEAQGFECGEDQADPDCMAVCTGTGPYTPSAPQGTAQNPPITSGTQVSRTPQETPGPNVGPPVTGGVSSNPCLPFGPGGYDYCANPAGTQPPGCVCPGTQTPALKGIRRTTETGQQPAQPNKSTFIPPSVPLMDQTMTKCLNAQASNMPAGIAAAAGTPQPAYKTLALKSAPASVQATPVPQLPAESQIFLEETAMALQVQTAHDTEYGTSPHFTSSGELDYMVGWFDSCLWHAGLQQKYGNFSNTRPDEEYAKYLGVPTTSYPVECFSRGYSAGLVMPPLTLLAPLTKARSAPATQQPASCGTLTNGN